jgi:hypothetical protein|tara:strand:+ start:2309 stop:2731 length:423 start_codon:yes stop_codon:yes gene_type:complete
MGKTKKKFKDTGVGKFLLQKIPNVVGAIAGDTPVGSVIKAIIGGSDELSAEDKAIALEKLKLEEAEIEAITRRWEADASSGSFLSQNVRPLTLMFFSIAYVIGWYLNYDLGSISGVLSLIVGAYFGSRGVEKVMGNNRHR